MDDFFDDFDAPGPDDWPIIFGISEEIAKEKREQDRIQKELDDEDDDYWEIIEKRW
jgi:hypothetical protein